MYYLMKPVFRDDTVTIDRVSHWNYSFTLGEVLPEEMPVPIEYEVDTDIGGSYLPTTFLPDPVFKIDFINALKLSGVDNFDQYEARIINSETGDRIQGYAVLNIIGKVACADMDASEAELLIEDQHVIRELVIDPAKTQGTLMFRLAQWTQMILIHDKITSQLPPGLCRDLAFEPVREI